MQWSRPISVVMPQELLEYLDEIAEINNKSRSEMIRSLIEDFKKEDEKDAGSN